jgi:uroporphyrinogen decarboxylase
VNGQVPVINFLTGNPALLPLCREAGGDVIGLDWRIDLRAGWQAVGHDRAVQGNLDPAALLADLRALRERTADVISQAEKRPGHIFNLGHGVMPEADHQKVKALVQTVHELGQR